VDIRNIQTFLRVAELESFTKAANEMNYAQSTITMRIQQLEGELGVSLFEQIGKKIYLTPEGREFLNYANEILQIMERVHTLGRQNREVTGKLRVGVFESLLFYCMLDAIPIYKNQYKNIDVEIKMGQAADLLTSLKQNNLDMVYISANSNTDSELQCCYKRQEQLVFVTNPNSALAQQHNVTLDKLLSYPLIATELSGICYGRLCDLAASYNLIPHPSLVVDNTMAIAKLLRKDMGVSFLPEYSVHHQLQAGELVQVDVDIPPQSYYCQILCHKNKWVSGFMEGFISIVRDIRPETQAHYEN
jgi:DNA-binding transcriptional LysR family regulator